MHELNLLEIGQWDQFEPSELLPDQKNAFDARRKAVRAVAAGSSMTSAAKQYGVHVKTLAATIEKARTIAPDRKPWGWRACIPHRVRHTNTAEADEYPAFAAPGAFKAFLKKATAFQELLTDYSGPLPGRNAPSRRFESFFKNLCKWIRDNVPKDRYPANDKTYARRSILAFLHVQREGQPFIDEDFEVEDANAAGQLGEVFALQLTDWAQYDGHALDCPFYIEGEDGNGQPFLQQILRSWLIVGYFALLRLCSSWTLSFGLNYSGTDFNVTCANSLRQWAPRDLVAPTMVYVPGSRIGTAPAIGVVAMPSITSADNAMAHRLDVNRQRMASQLLGVIHFGRAHVPETRGHLEAWNKRIEETVIREIPGAYRPAGENSDTATNTNTSDPQVYPADTTALEDLMDVTISGANATELDALQNRSPIQVLQTFVGTGGWVFAARDHAERANMLSTLQCSVKISGSKKRKRQPYVRFRHARYRSISLRGRWDLVGKKYSATVDILDARFINLYDEKGELFVVLRALRPWSRTPHSLGLRKTIHRLSRAGRLEIKGAACAVYALKHYLREKFSESREAATLMAKHRTELAAAGSFPSPTQLVTEPASSTASAKPASRLVDVYVPLTGRVNLGKKASPP